MVLSVLKTMESMGCSSRTLGIAVAVVIGGIGLLCYRKRRSKNAIHKTDYKKDVVYLYQFPSCRTIPCISPFAMKVESYLRLHKIPYESIRGNKKWSRTGQIPFIELNGKQINDSNVIIFELNKHFGIDETKTLSKYDNAVGRAVSGMLENQTVFSYFYYRYVNRAREFVDTWEFLPRFPRWIVGSSFPRAYRKKTWEIGIGRLPEDLIWYVGNQDLQAINDLLGDKTYFLGDQLTTIDCYLFGHLVQLLYIPAVDYPHTEYLHQNCQPLIDYVERVKIQLWPDWDQVCADHCT